MEYNNPGRELGGLARLLFDKAVSLWYSAVLIEVSAGLLAVIISTIKLSETNNVVWAVIGFILLVASYYLKETFFKKYSTAETMRRQSVLSLSLDWPIPKTQLTRWRCLSGRDVLKKNEANQLEENYYATEENFGPRKLLEMTQESAFWTRHLYYYLKKYVWGILVLSLVFLFLIITFAATNSGSGDASLELVRVVYLVLSLILSIDMLGWGLRLNRLTDEIYSIEEDLERMEVEKDLKESQVLRIVAEYNCAVVSGFPIPNILFKIYHDHISDLWKRR